MARIHQQLGDRYRILEKLGEGGMGEVFLVDNLELGRREAIKVLRSGIRSSPELLARFRREARAIDRLDHPNIVCLYGAGEVDSYLYLSMEYAEGESAVAWLERERPIPIDTAHWVLSQLAGAIEHAHARGVIHRDLKPGNLLLQHVDRRRPMLKVLDFGVAKIIDTDYWDSILSRRSEVFGTPAYLSPERAAGCGDEPRIDVYAFGCIAYDMIAGRPPFVGNLVKLLHDHAVTTPAPLSALRADCPRSIEDLIAHCLQKEPADRPSAADLAIALRSPTWQRGRAPSDPGALIATAPLSSSGAALKLRLVARALADQLIAHGAADPSLVRSVDGLVAAEAAFGRIESALGDLQFEREAAHTTAEIDVFADRAVDLGAAHATQVDELERLYAELLHWLDQTPAEVRAIPHLAALFARVAVLRERAGAPGSR